METKVNRLKTTTLIRDMVDSEYQRLRDAGSSGHMLAWTVGPPGVPLIPRAFGIPCHHMPSYAAYVASKKGSIFFQEAAEAEGYPTDVCSYVRMHNGLAYLVQKGVEGKEDLRIPLPNFIFGARLCPTHVFWVDSICRMLDIPAVIVDIPFTYEDSQYEANVAYVETQLKDVAIPAMELITKQTFDHERLREIMATVKRAALLRNECLEMCRNKPSPMTIFDCFIGLAPVMWLGGIPESVEYYSRLKAELEERVAKNVGAVPQERYRLYWEHLPIWYKLGSLSEKLASYGANLIAGGYTHGEFWKNAELIDPDKPLPSLAEQYVRACQVHTGKHKAALIAEMVEEYSLDGLVMHSARTCRLMSIGQYDFIDIMERRFGIPGLMIEADPADPNCYSDAQVDSRLQAFIETLEARKGAGGRRR